MENSAGAPKTPNSGASMDSPSLETLQLSFGNLFVNNGEVQIDGSDTPHGNRPSSFLPLNGSLTGAFPGPELSNRESIWVSSNTERPFPSFNGTSPNYTGIQRYAFAENLNGGYAFGESYPYNWASPPWQNSLFDNVSLFRGFPNENPLLHTPGFDIITLAMEEQSSKHLQALILIKDPEITELIFEGVIDNIFKLMTSQYGRYLFQKLVELDDKIMLQRIMQKLRLSDTDIFYASVDRYGSYSIKKMIKVLEKSPLIIEVVKALSNKFLDLMMNQTGQYVIFECLDVVDSQKNDLLYVEAINQCPRLATHERGCVSLNSFIVRMKGPRRDQLLDLICNQAAYLAQDRSGNFVVQCVLGLQNPTVIEKICFKLRGYYVKLSMQKGGSHLVEQCLKSSGLDRVVHEFLLSTQLFKVARIDMETMFSKLL